jgi:hypothetical protein
MPRLTPGFSAILAIVVGACSPNSGSTPGGPSDIASACDELASVVVEALRCEYGSTALDSAYASAFASRYRTDCAAELTLPGVSVSLQQLNECIAAYEALDCSSPRTAKTPASCGPLASGTRANGASCASSAQCQSLNCNFATSYSPDGGAFTPACGSCAATLAVGQPCTTGTEPCASHSYCLNGICVADNTVGDGGACNLSSQCTGSLICVGAGTCGPIEDVGASCTGTSDCKMGLVCVSGACATALAAGATCSPAASACDVGLVCDPTTLQCTSIGHASAGQPCDGEEVLCVAGSCQNAICPPVIPDGQPCDENDHSSTCDIFAECQGGVCVLSGSGSCN